MCACFWMLWWSEIPFGIRVGDSGTCLVQRECHLRCWRSARASWTFFARACFGPRMTSAISLHYGSCWGASRTGCATFPWWGCAAFPIGSGCSTRSAASSSCRDQQQDSHQGSMRSLWCATTTPAALPSSGHFVRSQSVSGMFSMACWAQRTLHMQMLISGAVLPDSRQPDFWSGILMPEISWLKSPEDP